MKKSTFTKMVCAIALSVGIGSMSAARPLGISVTGSQGTINWASVYSDGIQFAFAKATEGNYYQDTRFNANMNNGKAAGLEMGAYDFARPDLISANTEADYFWAFAGGKIIADGKSLFPAVDFETFAGHVGAGSYTAWVNQWAQRIKSKRAKFMQPVLYGSASGLCHLTGACTLSEWVANFNGQNPQTGTPWSCCTSCNYVDPGQTDGWTYWHFTGAGLVSGVSGPVNLNVYFSTYANLLAHEVLQ
jgi:lysozyme